MNKGHYLMLWIVCLVGFCCGDDILALNETWLDKLKNDLLGHYDPRVRPAEHYNSINVEIGLNIHHIEVDEEHSAFHVIGWLTQQWTDDKLKWDPVKYGNLSVFSITPDAIWKPDVHLYNNARDMDYVHYDKTNVVVRNAGKILWVPANNYYALCELNLRMWPFDEQKCHLKFGSWTHDGDSLNLSSDGEPDTSDVEIHNNEWIIREVSTKKNTITYQCCPEPYIDVTFHFTLQRQSSTHRAIVIGPAFVIMLLSLSVFWLPPQSGEKIFLNGIIILIVILFLLYFAQQLPAMSGQSPLIVQFFSTTLYLVAISTILSIAVIRLARSSQCLAIPSILKKQLDGWLGTVLGVGISHTGSNFTETDEDKEATTDGMVLVERRSSKQLDWFRLAALIDRLAFVIYGVIFLFSIFCYSL